MAFKLCPEVCLNFLWWEGEEEECSEGIHRTFQNRSEILSAGRIGVVLVLKSPPFWKGLKTHSLVWVFLLLCLISVNTPIRILRDFQFLVSVACRSRGPNLTHNSYYQCLYSQKGQWFSPTLTNSFPDQSAVPGLLQPSKANGHAAFMALEALHSSTTEKNVNHSEESGRAWRLAFPGPIIPSFSLILFQIVCKLQCNFCVYCFKINMLWWFVCLRKR